MFLSFFFPGGKNQTKSKEDELESTLQSYKKNHPSVHFFLSKTAKIIQSLRNSLACGQLATEGAFSKGESLFQIFSAIPNEPSAAIVVDFLVDVTVPKLLTEVIRSLFQKYPNVLSPEGQVGVRDAIKIPRFLMCGKPCCSIREFDVQLQIHVAVKFDLEFFSDEFRSPWGLDGDHLNI